MKNMLESEAETMKIVVDGKVWTVLKVYEKKQREKDVFLCENKHHIRECFQRCDFEIHEGAYVPKQRRKGELSENDKLRIEQEVLKGSTRKEIFQIFNMVPQSKIVEEITKFREKHGYKGNPTFGRNGRPVVQYDLDGNFIARYQSALKAAEATGISANNIWYAINDRRTPKGFIWRYEDDQFKREG